MRIEVMEEAFGMLLELAFETPVDYSVPSPLRIRHYRFLVIYFGALIFLTNYPQFAELAMPSLKAVVRLIENSYYNCLICSRVPFT